MRYAGDWIHRATIAVTFYHKTVVRETDSNMNYSTLLWTTLFIILTGVNTSSLGFGRDIPTLSEHSKPTPSQTYTHTFENLIRPKRTTQLKLCGNQLINMLSIICRVYHTARDSVKYEDDVEDLGHNSLHRHSKHIFRKKRSLENYSNTIRHSLSSLVSSLPQGLSTRCCVSSCSMEQLLLAC